MSEVGLRACRRCGAVQSYPRPVCTACAGSAFDPISPPLAGTVYSVSIIHRAPDPALAAEVPYAVALVRAAAGGLLLTRARPPVAIGDPVRVTAQLLKNGTTRLWAVPADEE